MSYCIYLRKSRSDENLELQFEEDTLIRHERTLIELSKKLKLNITKIYREVVSGETITSRPAVQELLAEVEKGLYLGVLVMEIERLARGDTVDQGIIAQTFKFSNTKIITPNKIFDPNNEFDEEYFEFSLFMSRREYKTINRRLYRGRIDSVKEGKFIGSSIPYGYDKKKLFKEKGFILVINEEEAKVVRLIYELYLNYMGMSSIAEKLNELNIETKKLSKIGWQKSTIANILKNPVYIGKINFGKYKYIKKVTDGKFNGMRKIVGDNFISVMGRHDKIISDDIFFKAQEIMITKSILPVKIDSSLKNPLSGIIFCGECGRLMGRKSYGIRNSLPTILCNNKSCKNVASYVYIVEERVIFVLESILENKKLVSNTVDNKKNTELYRMKLEAINKTESEILSLKTQLDKIYNFFERGVYDSETFVLRSKSINSKIKLLENNLIVLKKSSEELSEQNDFLNIKLLESALDAYKIAETSEEKNRILKSVVEKIEYVKKTKQIINDFSINVYPKIRINKNNI